MNSIIKALLGLCLFLLLILLVEWQLGKPEDLAKDEATVKSEIKDDLIVELPKLAISEKTVESYSQMLDSPLFVKGRKPIIDIFEEQVVEKVGKVDDLILLGIYFVKDKAFALFNKKGKDRKYLKKTEGEDVNGWHLEEIKTDRVVLKRQGRKETLMLRKPKPAAKKRSAKKTRKKSPKVLSELRNKKR